MKRLIINYFNYKITRVKNLTIKKEAKLSGIFIIICLIVGSLIFPIFYDSYNSEKILLPEKDTRHLAPENSGVMHYINLDGVINDAEWATAQHKIEFWLNVDKNHIDGNNYLYLGENKDNLYIALDLCSDNTTDETDEWIGLWFNTDNSTLTNSAEWENNIENGAESLIHDVQNDINWPFFNESLSILSQQTFDSHVNDVSEINVINGTLSGDLSSLNTVLDSYVQLNSELNFSNHITRLDFEINVSKWFPSNVIQDLYLENIRETEIVLRSRTNTAITSNRIVFWYSNGTYNLNDPDQVVDINSGTSWQWDNVVGGNLTPDNILKFSIIGDHSSAFTHDLEYLGFNIFTHYVNRPPDSGITPYSSINGYEIKWSFGPSSNNASDHRMFEIKIPKSELSNYETYEELGVIIGGYGTMSFEEYGFWVYSTTTWFRYYDSSNYNYFNMGLKPFNPPNAFVLTSDADILDIDGSFNLNWIASVGADDYSIYTHDSLITDINGSITLLYESLTNYSIPISGLTQGVYYYVAVAYNETGYYLSNSLKITVGLPEVPIIGGYEVYLIITLISCISFVLIWKQKRISLIKH